MNKTADELWQFFASIWKWVGKLVLLQLILGLGLGSLGAWLGGDVSAQALAWLGVTGFTIGAFVFGKLNPNVAGRILKMATIALCSTGILGWDRLSLVVPPIGAAFGFKIESASSRAFWAGVVAWFVSIGAASLGARTGYGTAEP